MRNRRRASFLVVLGSVLMAALLLVSPAIGASSKLETDLTGAEEVPGPGDPDGSGRATIILVPQQGRVCFVLSVRDIAPATAAHIHEAPFGVAGPVVVPLKAPTRGATGGCVSADPALIEDIQANPEDYYVNVHNAPFPAGAVRGQLGDDDNG